MLKLYFYNKLEAGFENTHEKETHRSKNLECHLCEIHCESSSDLKKHLVAHLYKEIRYKCEECDFVGLTEVTMEVHFGKLHSEKFECGLYDLEARSLENLEIHFNTCEVYKCVCCRQIF